MFENISKKADFSLLRILTNSDGIPGTKRAMIKKQFYYIAERDIWQAHHQKICQILTCCTVPKKSFFCFSLTPQSITLKFEVWMIWQKMLQPLSLCWLCILPDQPYATVFQNLSEMSHYHSIVNDTFLSGFEPL